MKAPVDDATAQAVAGPSPGLMRRLAAFVYEGVLLFGVVMIAGYLYGSLTQQRHALQGQTGLQAFLFIILGLYFVAFWSRGGQTVAMRAWHLRLVTVDGRAVSQARALARYLASWIWFLPALLSAHFAGLRSASQIFVLLAIGVVAYAVLALAHPQRQFWHDALCGTRLVTWRTQRGRAQSPAGATSSRGARASTASCAPPATRGADSAPPMAARAPSARKHGSPA